MSTHTSFVTLVSVSGVSGHDDSEGADRQTALQAVPVSARPSGPQLARKRKGDETSCPDPIYLLCFFSVVCRILHRLSHLQVRTTALAFLKRMYDKDQLRDYIEKFALNYMQLLVHPNPPSLLFGADKDTGLEYV